MGAPKILDEIENRQKMGVLLGLLFQHQYLDKDQLSRDSPYAS